MLLAIHDANLKKVAFIDNEKQDTLNYFDDVWTRNLETGSSTFEFTVFKKSIDKAYSYLNEKAFVSFKYNGKSYVFNVMTVEENEQTITCYCENLNLELINEYANSYKATKAMSFVEYCNAMDLLSFTYLSIGINEISDQKRTLEWEGQDTKLARLLSLANKFDAEIDFDTRLNADSTIKSFKVNVYHENDGTHQGVGRIRNDIRLTYGKNLKSITRKIDKTNVVNAIRPTGTKDGTAVVISGLSAWEEKNEDGIVEFYQKGGMLYAPISKQMYPSAFTSDTTKDQWIRKDITVDSDAPTVIRSAGIRELKKNAYPAITYDVDGFVDVEIGDTVKIHDDGFNPVLIVEARVSDQKISFTNPQSNKTTFANFKALENQLSDGIQKRLDELVEQAKPYTIKLSTDNGVVFKNNIGQSIVAPTLYKGSKPVTANVTWRWALDGNVTTGMTYTVRGADVTDTAILTVSAYVGNDEVATSEISFVNVLDGTMGTPGTPGKDGRTPYVHTAWANNATGTSGFSLDDSISKLYIGIYTDFEPADSTDPAKYNWTLIKGEKGDKGDDGLAGKDGKGITGTVITYGISSSETTQPTTWTTTVPTLVKGQYLWTKTVWTYTDNTKETGYTKTYIAKDGNDGTDGIAGKDGVGISSTTITYGQSASGTVQPTAWTSTVPIVQSGQYLWTKTIWSYTDGTNETGYSVARMGTDGAQGTPGQKGADGKTSYHHWAYADNADGTGLTTSDNGQRYQGYYSDYTQADSTDPAKYRWADRWAKIEVGGKNILRNSAFGNAIDGSERFAVGGVTYINKLIPNWNSLYNGGIPNPTTSYHPIYKESFNGKSPVIEFNESDGSRNLKAINATLQASGLISGNYTFSADIYATGAGTKIWFGFYYYNKSGVRNFHSGLTTVNITKINEWHRASGAIKLNNDIDFTKEVKFYIYSYNFTSNSILYLTKPQLEEGTVPTPYGASQSDIQANIDTKADSALTQEQLNALNEKNQVLEAELQAKASLDTFTEFEKAYQSFVTSNAENQAKSEADLVEAGRRIDMLVTQFGGLAELKTFIDTYMSSSNEGLIIGKNDASSTIKVSSDRISMFSAGKEVMYISQGVINIDNGIFTASVQIGKFRTEQYRLNADINVVRYVG